MTRQIGALRESPSPRPKIIVSRCPRYRRVGAGKVEWRDRLAAGWFGFGRRRRRLQFDSGALIGFGREAVFLEGPLSGVW